jgi:hypothetical protein
MVLNLLPNLLVRFCRLQVVLGHAAEFLQANVSSLDEDDVSDPESARYAFKWLQLADTAGLTDACEACIDRIVELDRSSCTPDKLEGMSRQMLLHLIEATLAVASFCRYCSCTRDFRRTCSYCSNSSR